MAAHAARTFAFVYSSVDELYLVFVQSAVVFFWAKSMLRPARRHRPIEPRMAPSTSTAYRMNVLIAVDGLKASRYLKIDPASRARISCSQVMELIENQVSAAATGARRRQISVYVDARR